MPIQPVDCIRCTAQLSIAAKQAADSKSRRGTEVAALFYSLIESAKLAGVEPKAYLRLAVQAVLRGETPPLPHQVAKVA